MSDDPAFPDPQDGELRLILRFDTDDLEFARGFECGELWSLMRTTPKIPGVVIDRLFRVGNTEMIMRMCEELGWTHTARTYDDGFWGHLRLEPVTSDGGTH